jgi:hypothetical protein
MGGPDWRRNDIRNQGTGGHSGSEALSEQVTNEREIEGFLSWQWK